MDFNFTDEQTMLRDSIAKFVAAEYDFDKRKAILKSGDGWSKKAWATFAELGLMAAPLPEEYGGLGGGPVDTALFAGVRPVPRRGPVHHRAAQIAGRVVEAPESTAHGDQCVLGEFLGHGPVAHQRHGPAHGVGAMAAVEVVDVGRGHG